VPLARLTALLLAAVVALAATVALARPAGADNLADEARLYELHNQARAQNGLAPLAYDPAAVGVARGWANELARSGNLRHNPDLVAQADAFITNQWTRLGENVGFSSTVDQVHTAYMNSPGHRANILGDYNRVGVGAVRDANGRLWTTVVFLKGPALTAPAPPPPPSVPASTFAPHSSAQAFASQQFTDVLGRPADASGLLSWTSALSTGAATPAGMVANLVDSTEAAAVVEPVNRLYWAYFRRSPDAGGVQYWVGRLRAGAGLAEVSGAFASSSEFRGTYGALTDLAFVDLVYRNVLGRGADGAGLTYWTTQLTSGRLDRGGVMVGFSESNEYKAATNAWNDVVKVYVGLLRRAPDPAGLEYWTGQLRNRTRSLADLSGTILASTEYRARFGG
jgi:hypothetical protein